MNNEEKEIIVDLLWRKYKKTKNKKLLELIEKINRINFSFEHINFRNCYLTGATNSNKPFIDANNFLYEILDLSNTYLKFSNNSIKVIALEEWQKLSKIKIKKGE